MYRWGFKTYGVCEICYSILAVFLSSNQVQPSATFKGICGGCGNQVTFGYSQPQHHREKVTSK